jgi:hypothetical protein
VLQGQAAAPIEVVCESHLMRDAIGPLITVIEGRWAYCAQNADGGHVWRRRAAISREMLESLPDQVRLICDDGPHLRLGVNVPDGDGVLTVAEDKWAYCSASRDEPHQWRDVEPMELYQIDHRQIAQRFDTGR